MLPTIYILIALFVLFFGSCIGSFLNVVIYRLPRDLNLARGRSFCPGCNVSIKPYDMIPVLSYLILGGKCRNCKGKISIRYPLVELTCGLFALYAYAQYGMTLLALCLFFLFCILLAVALIDRDTMTIPDSLSVALTILGIALIWIAPELPWLDRIIGIFAISLPMFLLCLAIPNAFGGGDIKLMAACGLILGWKNILLAMFFAAITGGTMGVYWMSKKKLDRKTQIPFGPFLCLGILLATLWGDQLLTWYFGLF